MMMMNAGEEKYKKFGVDVTCDEVDEVEDPGASELGGVTRKGSSLGRGAR
jgi:hypothetical protein